VRFGREDVYHDEMGDGEYYCVDWLAGECLSCSQIYIPSTETGLSRTDQKRVYQYDHFGSVRASRRGDAAANIDTSATRKSIRMRCTRSPVNIFSATPIAIPGKNRSEA
jgi:hypothetical protein